MNRARTSKSKLTILVADSEGVFRLGLRKLFSVEDDLRVVAQADSADQFLSMAHSFRPQIAFAQAEILNGNPSATMKRVEKQSPATRTVIVASRLSNDEVGRWVDAGASGVILRASDPEAFIRAARKVSQGKIWVPGGGAETSIPTTNIAPVTRPVDTLTRREKSIISGLTQGWRNREIAECLSISEQTVKNHLRSIYDKVGVSDRLELVLYAIHQHLELPSLSQSSS